MNDLKIKNDFSHVSRPRDGNITSAKDFPFQAEPTSSKQEVLNDILKAVKGILQNGEKIDDQTIEHLFENIAVRSTTSEELRSVAAIVKALAEHPTMLSGASQEQLMDVIAKLITHPRTNWNVNKETKDIVQDLSVYFPQLITERAREKFFDNVNSLVPINPDIRWNANVLINIAEHSTNGIDIIPETMRDQYVHLFGEVASQILSLDATTQSLFQKAAIALMQKTQFPYKFDADSFREALFTIPEDIRSGEYSAHLNAFDDTISNTLITPDEAIDRAIDISSFSNKSPVNESSVDQSQESSSDAAESNLDSLLVPSAASAISQKIDTESESAATENSTDESDAALDLASSPDVTGSIQSSQSASPVTVIPAAVPPIVSESAPTSSSDNLENEEQIEEELNSTPQTEQN
ncbi:MAG: hypothetical protein LBB11_03765 [Puniceicoccales bacterium]|jgi:hypothetical protein|nr:hypothetical protein [Puniceicoccales bacterium]